MQRLQLVAKLLLTRSASAANTLTVNGAVKQSSKTATLIWSIAETIERLAPTS